MGRRKTMVIPEIQHLIPEKINYYAEPFIWRRNFFRTSNIKRGIISDLNSHLMSFINSLKTIQMSFMTRFHPLYLIIVKINTMSEERSLIKHDSSFLY